jgi:hypothetical protein
MTGRALGLVDFLTGAEIFIGERGPRARDCDETGR